MIDRYCIYLRKSRADLEAELHGEGETLARHKKILLDIAKKRGLNLAKIYKEIVSGETISSRPVMQQLINEVERGLWTGVIVVEIERLARGDTVDQGIVAQSFKYSNTKIITPMKDYDPTNEYDEEYFEFGLFMSRREYKTINRRLQRGRIVSIKEGKYLGSKPPYGYRRKKLYPEKGYTLEIDEEQANVIKLIFDLYVNGESQHNGTYKHLGVNSIVNRLNELKIQPYKGNVWVPSTIRDILRNPVYMGKIRWNSRPTVKKIVDGKMVTTRPRAKKEDWILVDGLHESIIDESTFKLTQNRMSNITKPPVPHQYSIKNPLAGILVCGMCGKKMTRRPYANDYPDTLICKTPSCKNVSSQLHLVEEKIIDSLKIWLTDYELDIKPYKQNTNPSLKYEVIKESIRKTNQTIIMLEEQSDNIHDLLEQGIYSTDKFLERSKIITDKLKKSKKDKDELMNIINNDNGCIKSTSSIPTTEGILQIYTNLTNPSDKNKLLKEILDKVVYIKTVNGRWHGNSDDFRLILYPKLPKK